MVVEEGTSSPPNIRICIHNFKRLAEQAFFRWPASNFLAIHKVFPQKFALAVEKPLGYLVFSVMNIGSTNETKVLFDCVFLTRKRNIYSIKSRV